MVAVDRLSYTLRLSPAARKSVLEEVLEVYELGDERVKGFLAGALHFLATHYGFERELMEAGVRLVGGPYSRVGELYALYRVLGESAERSAGLSLKALDDFAADYMRGEAKRESELPLSEPAGYRATYVAAHRYVEGRYASFEDALGEVWSEFFSSRPSFPVRRSEMWLVQSVNALLAQLESIEEDMASLGLSASMSPAEVESIAREALGSGEGKFLEELYEQRERIEKMRAQAFDLRMRLLERDMPARIVDEIIWFLNRALSVMNHAIKCLEERAAW